jgi:hypothetical protein
MVEGEMGGLAARKLQGAGQVGVASIMKEVIYGFVTAPALIVVLLAICPPVAADESAMTGAEITTTLTDHTLQGTRDDGKSWTQVFQKSGVTFYSVGSAQSQGAWEVRGDQYCSQWPPNESWACYAMTRDGQTYTFVSASGTRTSGSIEN